MSELHQLRPSLHQYCPALAVPSLLCSFRCCFTRSVASPQKFSLDCAILAHRKIVREYFSKFDSSRPTSTMIRCTRIPIFVMTLSDVHPSWWFIMKLFTCALYSYLVGVIAHEPTSSGIPRLPNIDSRSVVRPSASGFQSGRPAALRQTTLRGGFLKVTPCYCLRN